MSEREGERRAKKVRLVMTPEEAETLDLYIWALMGSDGRASRELQEIRPRLANSLRRLGNTPPSTPPPMEPEARHAK